MFKTLQSRLFLIFLIISIGPILVTGYVSYRSEKQALNDQQEQNLFAASENLSADMKNFVSTSIADVKVLSNNPIFSDELITSKEIKDYLKNFETCYGVYDGIIVVDRSGRVLVDTDDAVTGKNISERNWFKEAVRGNDYFSDIYYSDLVKRPLLVLAAPIRDTRGRIVGVISPSIDLNKLWKTVDDFSRQRRAFGLSGFAFILNAGGDTIAYPDRSKIFFQNYFVSHNISRSLLNRYCENKRLFYDKTQENVVAFSIAKPNNGLSKEWVIGVSLPEKELDAPLNTLIIKYLLMLGLVILAIVIISAYVSRLLINPILQLVAVTSDLSEGKKVQPLEPKSYLEIKKLMNSFNIMVEKLREREKGHKISTIILETTDTGLLAVNDDRIVTVFNRKCEELFNIPKIKAVGKSLTRLAESSSDLECFINKLDILNCLRQKIPTREHEIEIAIDGKTYHLLVSLSCLPSVENESKLEGFAIIINDITEKRLMEEELIRSEKLKAAGQLAAGMAHEIRNPLTTIKGFMQMWGNNIEESKKETLELVLEEINRINEIITGFLTLAKPNTLQQRPTADIHQILNETLVLEEPGAAINDIRIVKAFDLREQPLLQPIQLKQVFINIIRNAIEAMPLGGQLKITTELLKNEKLIVIKFSDTGQGISDDILGDLGTPFFSTKETGTGIGLMICYQIVQNLKGTLAVESKRGEGTMVTISLRYLGV